ncbi:MAG: transposase, partial [Chloroflexi bacterium]|nr:transposase [Chloroflexota bacterium]
MFIREINKKNNNSDKIFRYCRLVKSVRTPVGPRQHVVLELGKLDLPKQQWKELANRIEQIASGQQTLFPVSEEIESLAQHYAKLLIKKKLMTSGRNVTPAKRHSEEIYVDDISSHDTRSLGPEHVGLSALKALKLDCYLKEVGISRKRADLAISQIIGRLVHPCSERELQRYTVEQSALDELLG